LPSEHGRWCFAFQANLPVLGTFLTGDDSGRAFLIPMLISSVIIPLEIRVFGAWFSEKTGNKSGPFWHIPCNYLSLTSKTIDSAGISPNLDRESDSVGLRNFYSGVDDE